MSDLDSANELDKELAIEIGMGATSATGGPLPVPVNKPKRRYKGFRLGFWIR